MPSRTQPPRQSPVVGIGASAGGVQPLVTIMRALPAGYPGLVLITLHLGHGSAGTLPALLDRVAALHVVPVVDGTAPEPGTVYVARPDEHLTLEDGTLRSTRGPRVNGHRPAIDAMFDSLASERGPGVVGVILSGTMEDGSRGAAAIKAAGGTVLVQAAEEAQYPNMIRSTEKRVEVDAALPVEALARRLAAATDMAHGRRVRETGRRDVNDHPREPR